MAAALVLKHNPGVAIWSRYVQISGIHGTIECREDASQFVQLKAMQAQLLMTTAS